MFNKIKEWLSPKKYGGGLSYGNIGTHVLPIQATISDMIAGLGTVSVTYAAPGVGKSNCISGVKWSYNGEPAGYVQGFSLVANSNPLGICAGPDGNIYLANQGKVLELTKRRLL